MDLTKQRTSALCRAVTFLLFTALVVPGCDRSEAPDEELAAETDGSGAEGEGSASLAAEGEAGEGSAEEPQEAVAHPTLPAPVDVTPGASSAMLSRAGGSIVAGDLVVEVQEGALAQTQAVEAALLASPEALGRALPDSLTLAALRTGPWNLALERTVLLDVPLNAALDEGTAVELLAYQPGMRAFIVVGSGVVDAEGRAEFRTRQLGDMIVRAAPVPGPNAASHCDAERIRLHSSWPDAEEDDIVGLTPEEHRMSRADAFSLLTDYRLMPDFARVDFKNEEVVDSGRTRRDERDHKDEDFLMDPAAARAVARLVELVDAEWVDPLTGGPSLRLRITESYDSLIEHSHLSTHYQGRGIDLTLSPVPPASRAERVQWYGRLAQLSVCAGFDYVLFEDQYHVHASVRPTAIAVARAEGDTVQVERASIAELGTWRETGVRLDAAEVERSSLAWDSDASAFSLRTAPVGAAEPEDGMVSPDGAREVRVRDGRAFLVYREGAAPLGSTDADGEPVDVRYPVLLDERAGAVQVAWDE